MPSAAGFRAICVDRDAESDASLHEKIVVEQALSSFNIVSERIAPLCVPPVSERACFFRVWGPSSSPPSAITPLIYCLGFGLSADRHTTSSKSLALLRHYGSSPDSIQDEPFLTVARSTDLLTGILSVMIVLIYIVTRFFVVQGNK